MRSTEARGFTAGHARRETAGNRPVGMVALLEEAPELASALGSDAEAYARALRVPLLSFVPGPWDPPAPGDPARTSRAFGLLVLDGFLTRRVMLGDRVGAELLGRGDLIQPWLPQTPEETLEVVCSWEILSAGRLAVLDASFEAAVARWPALGSALIGCATKRSRMLAFQHAACHFPALEDRLLALLWAFAERWGRVTLEGVVLPFRLTHAALAEIAGATRPSVSTALGALSRKGLLVRRAHVWVLPGEAPANLSPAGEPVAAVV